MPIQHQLAGAVALLIASKLSDQPGLSLSQLQEYTGQAFTGQELRGWEVALLTKLGWDVSSQTAWAELVVLVMGTDKEHLLLPCRHLLLLLHHSSSFSQLPPPILAQACLAMVSDQSSMQDQDLCIPATPDETKDPCTKTTLADIDSFLNETHHHVIKIHSLFGSEVEKEDEEVEGEQGEEEGEYREEESLYPKQRAKKPVSSQLGRGLHACVC